MAAEEKKKVAGIRDFVSKAGNKFKLQKVTPTQWLDILDEAEEGKGKRRKMYAAVLENIVVQPQMSLDDFDDFGELDEVVAEAIRFQSGK